MFAASVPEEPHAPEEVEPPMLAGSDALHFLVSTYRRDSSEVIGAVRRSSVEFLGMEQMPGGKFQVTARTMSGADTFVSPVKTSLAAGQACLEDARRSFGGEETLVDDRAWGRDGGSDDGDAVADDREQSATEGVRANEIPVRLEPRIPTFAFADIEAPELPTSVR